jgi:predicted GH43/DUF377 family glycosyl hydrolase
MAGSRETSATLIVLLLLFGASGLAYSVIPKVLAASPLCVDYSNQPILQDKDWRLINPSMNYSDYTFQYVEPSVIKQGNSFIMYVRIDTNSSSGIYRGTSSNGAVWNFSSKAVLGTGPSGTWDASTVFSPDVVWNGTGYMMYYVGDGGTTSLFRQIGVAFSSDGIHWTKYSGNPVITHGPGTYDAQYTRGPSVIYDGGTYKMWYWGVAPPTSDVPLQSSIDFATSADGVHWSKFAGNPIFLGFHYRDGTTSSDWPSVAKLNGTYVMAFSGYSAQIGFATSTDGISWRLNNQTNVLLSTTGWHNGLLANPSLLIDGGKILLWFSGGDATSHSSPYVSGIGFASCGILLLPPPVTTTTSATTTSVATSTLISTSISTSTVRTTQTLTVETNPNASFFEVAIAGVVGFAASIAVTIVLLALRMRSRHSSKAV